MCALPSISTAPYRTPLLPPSRSSYLSDFNHLNNGSSVAPSPYSRRIHSMQRKPPLEADTNFHKQQAQIRINISKVKFSLLLLALMSIVSILFAFASLLSLLSIQWRTTESADLAVDGSLILRNAMHEIASSLSLIAVTTSISTFLLSTLQLFFALKMLKANPTSIKRVLSFLSGGRFLRCIVYTAWFFAVLFFIIGSMLQWMLLAGRVGVISRGVGGAFGIASTALCTAGLIHCIYVWCATDDKEVEESYINGKLIQLIATFVDIVLCQTAVFYSSVLPYPLRVCVFNVNDRFSGSFGPSCNLVEKCTSIHIESLFILPVTQMKQTHRRKSYQWMPKNTQKLAT